MRKKSVSVVALADVGILLAGLWFSNVGVAARAAEGGASGWQGTERTNAEGVVEVHNPKTPIQGDRKERLRLSWHLVLDNQDDEVVTTPDGQELPIIGMITAVEEGEDGTIYLLDVQMKHVLAFASDGTYLGVRSGPGEGPSESYQPMGLLCLPDGDIGIVHGTPAKIIVLDRNGVPQETLKIRMSGAGESGFVAVQRVGRLGSHMVVHGTAMTVTGAERLSCAFLSVMDAEALEIVRIMERTTPLERLMSGAGLKDLANVSTALWSCRKKLLIVEDQSQYRFSIYGESGRCERVVSREYERLEYTEEERNRMQRSYDKIAEKVPLRGDLFGELPKFAPCIAQLIARPDGSCWVWPSGEESFRGMDGSRHYDEFDTLGRYQYRVRLQAEDIGPLDQLFFLESCVIALRGMTANQVEKLGVGSEGVNLGNRQISISKYVTVS